MEHLKLPSFCKTGKETCDCEITCYPTVLLHEFTKQSQIPKKYTMCTPENLPIQEENPKTYALILRYLAKVTENVQKGTGLYLYSLSSPTNPLGTGTGKTTTACTIANYYLKKRVIEHIKKEKIIEYNPVLFLSASQFQNVYNAQFSGSAEVREQNADKFQNLKQMAMKAELLIIDDIATRSGDTYLNQIFEVIDTRVVEDLPMIITSNNTIKNITETLGERTTSRIEGATVPLAFEGKDFRKKVF